MSVVFRPTTAAAVYLRKQAERLGQKLLNSGAGSSSDIFDGFLLRAVKSDRNAIVTAIDLPRFYGAARFRSAAYEGTTMIMNQKVPDALSYLQSGYSGGPPAEDPVEGFYADDGIVYIGDITSIRESLAVRGGPATACRTAILVVDSIALANDLGTEVVAFTFQVNRVNAATTWSNTSPPGSSIGRLPMNTAPLVRGAVPVIEFSPESLGIPRLQPHTSGVNKVVAGPAIEANKHVGFVTGSALFDSGLVPMGTIGRIDEHCIVARYSVVQPSPVNGEPQPQEGYVDWVTTVKPVNIPEDFIDAVMHSPHIWAAWATFSDTRYEPEVSLPPVLLLIAGSYTEYEFDPDLDPTLGVKKSSYAVKLLFNATTGSYTETLIDTFDGSDQEYTQLEEPQYIPVLPFTREEEPCLLVIKRMVQYEITSPPSSSVDRKVPIDDYFYTTLDDLSYHVITASGTEVVSLGDYYLATGARFASADISGSGRYAYSGPFVRPVGAPLGGEFWPTEGNAFNGGSPIGMAACLCAPGILAMVVSPKAQYLDALQDRFIMLYDVVNHVVLQVNDTALLNHGYGANTLFQLTCIERGTVEDGLLTKYPVLLLTVGQLVVGTGVHVTHDAGQTTQQILNYPNQAAAFYLGSPISPAQIGVTAGSPSIAGQPV